MATLEAKNITKIYGMDEDAVKALDDVSIHVPDNEFTTIVGPSGCGKTTLLRILDGLIEPTAGEILIDGSPVTGSGQDRGMVFQSFNLFPWRSVVENVAFGLECAGVEKVTRNETARRYVELVGLGGFEESFPYELSGGMQQRVGLARALAIDPDILLMDEPFGALDAQTRELMQTELLKIWSQEQKTCVFITHDIDEAVYLSDRVIVLSPRPGRIRKIVDIPFERPRYERKIRDRPEFSRLHTEIWDSLFEDQSASASADAPVDVSAKPSDT